MRRFRHQRNKVPERVMGRPSGGHFVVRFGLYRMDEIGKLDGVLNEKHRHVVANQVEIAFIGEELDGKTTYITNRVARPPRPLYRGKSHKHRRDLLRVL
ncbi:hypothetical protein D3C77_609320 [compost metagenome]